MKPDFEKMSKAELRSYVMAHRDDNEAFYMLVDRLKADNKNAVRYPCPNSPEDWEKVPKLIEEQIKKLEK